MVNITHGDFRPGSKIIVLSLEQTQRKTGLPADTALEAIIAGMKHLGVKTVAIGSRWVESTNRPMVDYLRSAGLKVESVTSRSDRGGSASTRSLQDGMRLAVELGREAMRVAPKAIRFKALGAVLPG